MRRSISNIVVVEVVLAISVHVCLAQNKAGDFLYVHNRARAQVGVGPLKWNQSLASYAQRYANKRSHDCNLEHSGGPFGENIAEGYEDMKGSDAVKFWLTEKPNYDYHSNACVNDDCLHYTQIVWRNSRHLGSDSSLEDIVKSLALNTQQFQMSTQQFQNETRSSIQSLESQVSKLATSMSKLESQGKLPSQTEMNPRQNVSAITLRSGRELEEPIRKRDRGHGLNAETEPETEVVMKKPAKVVQNKEKSSPLDGTFNMEFDGEIVKFNAMKRPNEISSVCKVGVINPIVQESLELHQQGKLSNLLSESIDQVCLEKSKENIDSDDVQEEVVYELEALKPKLGDPPSHDLNSSHTNTSPLVMQESELKLKQLPNYLKYAFLEVQVKEEKLIQMLGEYKEAIAYVKDLSLSTCMQRIPLGVNYDPIQEVQRHFNPPRMEVFKNEFQKLLDADMIYLNSDSNWVNQMQVMPNEIGTVVANSEWVDYLAPKPPDKE
ncbi:basic form of pathogenesis-related protein 1-like [Senna tora]|uniref:Basic form of pathogenesis-related protein 1-like n=1 Tax=Senna tora TaxID=362788 RepID=A0A835CI09_9FABA|nr:basic form of pathogenesis-related protein 1-like [Senna tora]